MRDCQILPGDAQGLITAWRRTMLTEFISITWRGGITIAVVLILMRASGLLH